MVGSNLIDLEEVLVKHGMHLMMEKLPLADATDPRGGALLCSLPGAVLTGFGTCMFDNRLGSIDQTKEAWVIIRGKMERSQIFVFY